MPKPRLNRQIADEIRAEYADGGTTQRALANKYDVSQQAICSILNNESYPPDNMLPNYIEVREAAKIIGAKRNTIYNWAVAGKIDAITIDTGRRRKVAISLTSAELTRDKITAGIELPRRPYPKGAKRNYPKGVKRPRKKDGGGSIKVSSLTE